MSELKALFDQTPDINNIISDIATNDEMYLGNRNHYFQVGQSAIKCIKLALLASGRDFSEVSSIMDIPCGYGRVMRMLKELFPRARITACDLLNEAVDFCRESFNAIPLYSSKNINTVTLDGEHDLIWCGSLLTHLDHDQWVEFIDFFERALALNGVCVFTTHGRHVADVIGSGKCDYGVQDTEKLDNCMRDYSCKGFGFMSYSHSSDYGISVSTPSFVLNMLERKNNLKIISYLEQGWDNHQDVVAFMRV